MSNNFRVGQRVVCINDDWHDEFRRETSGPNRGSVNTIAEIGYHPDWPYLVLLGLNGWSDPPYYSAAHFRPAVERGTEAGMAILRKLLNKEKVGA